MDTVWIRLTRSNGSVHYYMFGPTGVTNFNPVSETEDKTILHLPNGKQDLIEESSSYIMQTLQRIRKTKVKAVTKAKSKRKK